MAAQLEHVNITTSEPHRLARLLEDVFGWRLRWAGDAIHGGTTLHVGSDDTYIAIYGGRAGVSLAPESDSYSHAAGLNHIAILVDDLEETEAKVRDSGFLPRAHADYEPGRRFYFTGPDSIEFEVVSYG